MSDSPRAYDPNSARLIRRATPVYSLDDIRRAIAIARSQNEPCNLELGADVVIDERVDIPQALRSFSLDGGGRFRISLSGAFSDVFVCGASPTIISNTQIVLKAGASVACLFRCRGTPTALSDLRIDGRQGVLTSVCGVLNASQHRRLIVSAVDVFGASNFFAPDGGQWLFPHVADLGLFPVSPAVTMLAGPGVLLNVGLFSRIDGTFSVNLIDASSAANVFSQLGSAAPATFSTAGSAANGHMIENLSGFASTAFSERDVVASNAGSFGIEAVRPASKTLNSAGPTLTPTSTFLRVTHGAGSSGNVTIAAGVDGQRLTLFFVSYAGTAVYTTGVGNLMLAGSPFTPTANDILELIYDATSARWVETNRSINA